MKLRQKVGLASGALAAVGGLSWLWFSLSLGESSAILASLQLLLYGALGVLGPLLLGLAGGSLASLGPKWVDSILARALELCCTLPTLVVLALSLSASPSVLQLSLILALLRGVRLARNLRIEILQLSQLPWALAAIALGAPAHRLLFRQFFPALRPLLAIEALTCLIWCLSLIASLPLLPTTALNISELPAWSSTQYHQLLFSYACLTGAALLQIGRLRSA